MRTLSIVAIKKCVLTLKKDQEGKASRSFGLRIPEVLTI